MVERYEINKRQALKFLPGTDPIPMRSPDGTKKRNFTRRRAISTISNAVSRIYIQDSIDGDVVIFTTTKGTEWVYEATLFGDPGQKNLLYQQPGRNHALGDNA